MSSMVLGEEKQSLVLLADDDRLFRKSLQYFLEKEGYKVVQAQNGLEALEIYTAYKPDIVLLDALMPEIDGFSCCQSLHNLAGRDCPPILMITGLGDRASVDQAFEAGAIDYVTKPIHWAVLRQRVKRLLEQVRLQRELETANLALQQLVNIDGLTKVANRRRFNEYLEAEWKYQVREHLPLSLLMCDIDFFKSYNDTYGHQAGDACLQNVAQAIQFLARRPSDLVARYGGEEFAVILPNTELRGAEYVAEQILSKVRDLQIPNASSQIGQFVTLSIGVASTKPTLELSPETLIFQADLALYTAKHQGRDRLVLSTEMQP